MKKLIMSLAAVGIIISAFAYGNYGGGMNLSYIQTLPKGDLSETEKNDLLHMREEEKLARDVYLALYRKWGLRVFENIARSEQRHMDAIKALLDKYGLQDPALPEEGKFSNPTLQDLYNKLVSQGSQSVVDALKVGATIEDLDIKDLDDAINQTDNEDIKLVYEHLRNGSYNHLRAFVRTLQQYGASYEPQYISYEEYQEILSTSNTRGRGNGMGMGRGHGFKGGGRW